MPRVELSLDVESDGDRRILREAIASARAAELLKSHYVARRTARAGGRRVPASDLDLPDAFRRRVHLLERLERALAREPGPANEAAPAPAGAAAGTAAGTDARRLVETYLDRVWGQRDLAALDELLDPSYRRHVSALLEPLTVEGQRARLAAMQEAFPDVSIELGEVVAAGDTVAFQSVMRGTQLGQFRGPPATGRTFTVHLVDLARTRNGRLLEHWGGPDLLDLVTQLGATVEPGTAAS